MGQKALLAGTRCSSELGAERGQKANFFFICVAKNPEQCHQSQPRWWELKLIKDSAKLMLSLRLSDTHSESNVGKK